ncbi:MAG: type II toxin-antitoxin system Phd/YefM family antitoxin [Dehalococcoidia bacterium]|nr:type II toxin-antitoxin system Phd/YefM family antitoxin [Dehalococcoidia bacterium]
MGVPRIVPISDLRADAASLVKETRETRRPVFITQRGRATAVLLSIEEYEKDIDRVEMLEALDSGQEDIASGMRGYTLEEVNERLKAVIARHE